MSIETTITIVMGAVGTIIAAVIIAKQSNSYSKRKSLRNLRVYLRDLKDKVNEICKKLDNLEDKELLEPTNIITPISNYTDNVTYIGTEKIQVNIQKNCDIIDGFSKLYQEYSTKFNKLEEIYTDERVSPINMLKQPPGSSFKKINCSHEKCLTQLKKMKKACPLTIKSIKNILKEIK